MIKFVPLTAAYAGLLGLVYLALCWRVVDLRREYKVGLGDGGHEPLTCAIRAHGNFVEYVPLCLILLMLLELNGTRSIVVNILGAALVLARILHGYGLTRSPGRTFGRFYGTALTWLVLLAGIVLNLYVAWY